MVYPYLSVLPKVNCCHCLSLIRVLMLHPGHPRVTHVPKAGRLAVLATNSSTEMWPAGRHQDQRPEASGKGSSGSGETRLVMEKKTGAFAGNKDADPVAHAVRTDTRHASSFQHIHLWGPQLVGVMEKIEVSFDLGNNFLILRHQSDGGVFSDGVPEGQGDISQEDRQLVALPDFRFVLCFSWTLTHLQVSIRLPA